MKRLKINFSYLIAFFLIFTIALTGCSSKKAAFDFKPPNVKNDLTSTITPLAERSKRVYESLSVIPGINNSHVVVSGNTAVVGLEVDRNASPQTVSGIKMKIENVIRNADTNIHKVIVTSDKKLVDELKRVSEDVRQKKPLLKLETKVINIIEKISNRK